MGDTMRTQGALGGGWGSLWMPQLAPVSPGMDWGQLGGTGRTLGGTGRTQRSLGGPMGDTRGTLGGTGRTQGGTGRTHG